MNTLVSTKPVSTNAVKVINNLRAHGHYVAVVKGSDFDLKKWTLREVELSDSNIHPKAREEANRILKSTSVKRWILAEEIEKPKPQTKPIVIPWKSIGTIAGTFVVAAGLVALAPIVLTALALMLGLMLLDPMLIACIEDVDGREIWVSCGWWFD
jgi:hypothetical protein